MAHCEALQPRALLRNRMFRIHEAMELISPQLVRYGKLLFNLQIH